MYNNSPKHLKRAQTAIILLLGDPCKHESATVMRARSALDRLRGARNDGAMLSCSWGQARAYLEGQENLVS